MEVIKSEKVFKSNVSSFVCIGLVLLLIDFNNLSILEYIFLTTSTLAFVASLVNLAVTYYCEREERKYT